MKMSNRRNRESRQRSKQLDMLNGSLLDKILLFALPLAASSILQQLFNSADVAVVGRFAGSQALAAVGSNSPVINLQINLFVGLSVGANVVISNYIGRKDEERVREAVHTALVIALFSGIFLLFLGIALARPILTLMDTPGDVMELAVLYLRIYFLGMPFIMFYNFGSSILRSKGDTRRPMYCLIVSGIVNLILNLILVVVFQLSVAGVGIATVIANVVSAGMIWHMLRNEEDPVRFYPDRLALKKEHLMRIIRIGAPAGIQGMVFSLSNVCIQTAVNSFGSDGVAGSAAAVNFEFFVFYMVNGFGQAAVTFTSQNYGAKKPDRCKKVFRLSMTMGVLISAAMCAVFLVGSRFFLRFYTVQEAVTEFALIRMTHILFFSWMINSYEISGAALRGMGYSLLPACITVVGTCGFRLLWIYAVFGRIGTFESLMNVYPATWVLTGTAMLIAYFIIRRRAFAAQR